MSLQGCVGRKLVWGFGGGVEGGDDHDAACWMSPQGSLVTADGQGPWWNSEGGLLHGGGRNR